MDQELADLIDNEIVIDNHEQERLRLWTSQQQRNR